ncbi:MAG: hypothetical protein HC803_00595 [Saprospiraceae bacterium]|nr:hypothetical protein [Saprospiraceae bacterium]
MRYLKLVLVIGLVIGLGFQSNADVTTNISTKTGVSVIPANIVEGIIIGRNIQINATIQTGYVQVIISCANGEIIYNDILTANDVRTINDLPVGDYQITAIYQSYSQIKTITIK